MKRDKENKRRKVFEDSTKLVTEAGQGVNSRNKSKVRDFFELPKELVSKEPKLTIMGFSEMLVENYKGILEYEDFYVRINTEIGTININGFNLELIQMTEDDVIVTGKIQSVDIEDAKESAI